MKMYYSVTDGDFKSIFDVKPSAIDLESQIDAASLPTGSTSGCTRSPCSACGNNQPPPGTDESSKCKGLGGGTVSKKSGSCYVGHPVNITQFFMALSFCFIHFVPFHSISVYHSIIDESQSHPMWPIIIDRFPRVLRRCTKSLAKNFWNRSKPKGCLTIVITLKIVGNFTTSQPRWWERLSRWT